MQQKNPAGELPEISRTVFISESAVIIGNVEIKGNVYIAPNTTIRADEPGSRIIIGEGCNIQDNVVIHALEDSTVIVGDNTSLAHGCIIHGPCEIRNNCFIGFGSVVFNCTIEEKCIVLHRVLAKDVRIPARKMVENGAVLEKQDEADRLKDAAKDLLDFSESVVKTNLMLAESYSRMEEADAL